MPIHIIINVNLNFFCYFYLLLMMSIQLTNLIISVVQICSTFHCRTEYKEMNVEFVRIIKPENKWEMIENVNILTDFNFRSLLHIITIMSGKLEEKIHTCTMYKLIWMWMEPCLNIILIIHLLFHPVLCDLFYLSNHTQFSWEEAEAAALKGGW